MPFFLQSDLFAASLITQQLFYINPHRSEYVPQASITRSALVCEPSPDLNPGGWELWSDLPSTCCKWEMVGGKKAIEAARERKKISQCSDLFCSHDDSDLFS